MLFKMETNSNRTTATLLHISMLSQYFIPFGNFIFPIIIWSSKKKQSEYLDVQGKQVINFQISIFIYSLILSATAVTLFIATLFSHLSTNNIQDLQSFNFKNFELENSIIMVVTGTMAVVALVVLKIMEFILILLGAIKVSDGKNYKYPFTIGFFK